MIEDDRYRLYVVQQIDALNAAAGEVSVIMLEDQLKGCVADAVGQDDGDAAIREMAPVLRRALRP